ncbi:nicotinate-nucleotide adenylyltransferase [Pseudoroseicyclus aestuarii]|uniref:Probable nicotinate-nucleotide adenylyltransferase n=1 Tax=Pseudoroseicyclus aestuarii TaxID=1795041 RepID=A0A318SWN9_9RHOB|nr:nicotinate-nucleotide adenylyltransferase [Pseudoroseicyclus aestuarii]PYE84819.1 nicotinate-nucleotide adenylyltransferase [Pseudoroseicyclus aestuarii]
MRRGFPVARAGQSVGLLGGSFDPAHEGHVQITLAALQRLRLDRVWWLVSPGNPLKPRGPAPMEERIAAARAVMRHPRVAVTDIEARIGTRYTAQTLRRLQQLYPGVDFVWMMGSDNLVQLHRWQDWRQIMDTVPACVFARPGTRLSARLSRAARVYRGARLPAHAAERLVRAAPPAWAYLNLPLNPASSTEIRAREAIARSRGPEAVKPLAVAAGDAAD